MLILTTTTSVLPELGERRKEVMGHGDAVGIKRMMCGAL